MRLVCADIAGFGRLVKLHMDFEEGLNSFLRENGWGKTTFCVFVKSMLFGMPYSRARKVLSEREHYRPWSDSAYGGSLTIQVDDRRYRIERTFGKKDTDDTFELYDDETGLKSSDYTENIGQELFLVDRDSFEKSVFIPQDSIATNMTDSLNAKMGDLASAQDDINNFDLAKKRLEEAKKVYTKNSKLDPGKLLRVKGELKKSSEASEQLPALSDAMEKQKQVLMEKNEAMRVASEKKAAIADEITVVSKNEQKLGAYREKKESYKKIKEQHDELEEFFKGKVPEPERLEELDECERSLENNRKQAEAIMAKRPEESECKRLETLFAEGEVDDETLSSWEKKAERMLSLRLKGEHSKMSEDENALLSELKLYFAKKVPTDEELEKAVGDAADLAQLEGQLEALEDNYRSAKEKNLLGRNDPSMGRPKAVVYGMILVVVCAIAGAVTGTLFREVTGELMAAVFIVAAIVFAAITYGFSYKSRRDKAQRLQALEDEENEAKEAMIAKAAMRDAKQQECLDFLDNFLVSPKKTYAQMMVEIQSKKEIFDGLEAREKQAMEESSESIEELSGLVMELYTPLEPYAKVYGIDLYAENRDDEVINRLKEDVKAFAEYRENNLELQKIEKTINEARQTLDGFFADFKLESDTDKEKLREIRKSRDNYLAGRERLAELEAAIKEFEENHSVNENSRTVESLQKEQDELDVEISSVSEQIVKAKEVLSELNERFEELEEIAERKSYLEEKEKEYKKKVRLYEQTLDYLSMAKEKFLARYMGPLRQGLKGYLKKAGVEGSLDISNEDFTLDMDLNILLSKDGSTHSAEYLSAGYRDLTAVCARLALVDVLYKDQDMFLVLDDPFANLDDDKTEKAKALLEAISESKQVIYYTCHESRFLDKKPKVI